MPFVQFKITFVPYYIRGDKYLCPEDEKSDDDMSVDEFDNNEESCVKLSNDKISKYLIKNKQKEMKQITEDQTIYLFIDKKPYVFEAVSYEFDKKNLLIKQEYKSKKSIPESKLIDMTNFKNELTKTLIDQYGNGTTELCGKLGPDGWMEGDLYICNRGGYDYEFGVSFLKIKNFGPIFDKRVDCC